MAYVVLSNGRRDQRNRLRRMRNATRREISLECKGWSCCRTIHSCFMNSLLSLGAEKLKNVGGCKHKVSDEHVIYLTCGTWQDRLLKKKRRKHYGKKHSTEVDRTSATVALASATLAPLVRDKHMSLPGDH